jgi:hypothetical protein
MNSTGRRVLAGIILAFALGYVIVLSNGRGFIQALSAAALLALIAGVTVGILSWAVEYALRKGYPGWLGFLLIFFLNFVGIFILLLLPAREASFTR